MQGRPSRKFARHGRSPRTDGAHGRTADTAGRAPDPFQFGSVVLVNKKHHRLSHLFAALSLGGSVNRRARLALSVLCLALRLCDLCRGNSHTAGLAVPFLQLRGGTDESTQELVRLAREEELAMLAEEGVTVVGCADNSPTFLALSPRTADLVRQAHVQEMNMLAEEMQESWHHSHTKRVRENGDNSTLQTPESSKRRKFLEPRQQHVEQSQKKQLTQSAGLLMNVYI